MSSAFPCVMMLIKETVHKTLPTDMRLSDIPTIEGMIYEDEFFVQCKKNTTITIYKEIDSCETYTFTGVLYVESGSDVTIGPLFQLRHTYPIIDGVGYATLPYRILFMMILLLALFLK